MEVFAGRTVVSLLGPEVLKVGRTSSGPWRQSCFHNATKISGPFPLLLSPECTAEFSRDYMMGDLAKDEEQGQVRGPSCLLLSQT